MQNVVVENTRETQTTSTLIDLIVTTRRDLISKCGVIPLGISDHNLVYATMKLKNKRPPPKYIKTLDRTLNLRPSMSQQFSMSRTMFYGHGKRCLIVSAINTSRRKKSRSEADLILG